MTHEGGSYLGFRFRGAFISRNNMVICMKILKNKREVDSEHDIYIIVFFLSFSEDINLLITNPLLYYTSSYLTAYA